MNTRYKRLLGSAALSADLSPIVGPVPLREIDHIRPPPWQTQPEAGN